ncbi:hypothetical protein ACFQY5_26490 [Paeniroseomonas aquatica]|uniref:hypothetical protein n=1 Tax=Paeniroseomonas aquatica TaxID=373043 RepID=UPI00362363C2
MNFASGNRTLYFLARSTGATASRALAGLAFLSVAGCAQLAGPAAETAPPPRAAAPGPMDAVTTFAATARPGAETTLPWMSPAAAPGSVCCAPTTPPAAGNAGRC